MKVLVTSGATREFIDGVRFITNFSSGHTGTVISDFLAAQGDKVTVLSGESSEMPKGVEKTATFDGFTDLDTKVQKELSENHYDAVIHLAAVSDYSVKEVIANNKAFSVPMNQKIDSSEELQLILKRNHKIIDNLRKYSKNKGIIIVGFKLTQSKSLTEQENAVKKLTVSSTADFVVHNDVNDIREEISQYRIYKNNHPIRLCQSRQELAQSLSIMIRRPGDFNS
jgi:phosphopantothenoylcysteine decarboxylase/phosphopantothenate--cysteine ligase